MIGRETGGALLCWGLLALGLWLAAATVAVDTDPSRLLPEAGDQTQRLLLDELRTGSTARLLLIALEGRDPERLAEQSGALLRWMRQSGFFRYAGNGSEPLSKKEREVLFRYRYVLSPALDSHRFSREHLRAALQARLHDLTSPLSAALKTGVATDPTGEFHSLLARLAPWRAPARHLGVWFSPDHKRALLLAETRAQGFDSDAQAVVQTALRLSLERIDAARGTRLVLSGPAVFGVEARDTIQADVWRLGLIASALVVCFLYVSYGSARLVALSAVPILSGIVVATLGVGLVYGRIHGITLAFGITLLGVVDDYPIHLFSRLDGKTPAAASIAAIWPPMRLAVITTALGFSALLFTGFPGLSQLGLFAILGLVTGAAVTRFCLPRLVPAAFAPRRSGVGLVRVLDAVAHARSAVPLAVIFALLALWRSGGALWEEDIANLSPVPVGQRQLDQELRDALGAPDVRAVIVIEAASREAALLSSEALGPKLEALVAQRALAGYEMAARYLPSEATQRRRQESLPDAQTLAGRLQRAVAGLPYKPGVFDPFLAAVAEARTLPPVGRQALGDTALGLRVDGLLVERAGRWLALVPLRGAHDPAPVRAEVASWQDPSVSFLDLKEESNRILVVYRDEMLRLVALGALSIGCVLLIGLRSLRTVLRVLLPIASALVVVTALLNGMGERLSLFHLASLLLVVGLGLDYALFFNQPHRELEERGRTVYGLCVCSATTVLVFGVLAFSVLPVLRAIGLTAALGSLSCLLCAALLARRNDATDFPP